MGGSTTGPWVRKLSTRSSNRVNISHVLHSLLLYNSPPSDPELGPERTPKTTKCAQKPYTKHAASDESRPDFVEFFTKTKGTTKTPLGENEYFVHWVDWYNDPPTWDGQPIPPKPIDEVFSYLQSTYGVTKGTKCKWNGCGESSNGAGWLKNHILSKSHMNLRRKCHNCRVTARPDNWSTRHKNCASHRHRHAEEIRKSPGAAIPTYNWKAS